jgi:ABC-type transporter Mla MlaB component
LRLDGVPVTLDSDRGWEDEGCVLRWQLGHAGGRTTVALIGVLDEDVDLRPLIELTGEVAIDLSGVHRISSTGVREWIDFMRILSERCRVTLVACSPASVIQLNLIANFRGRARVESFIAPYECPCCGAEREVLLDATVTARSAGRTPLQVPALSCACGSSMELAELPERYLTFLMDQPRLPRAITARA